VTIVQAGEVFDHVMIFKPSNVGKFGTIVMDKGLGNARLWEYPSVKLASVEADHQDGKLVLNWNAIANKCERTTASQQNDATSMAALTRPTIGLPIIFNQVSLRLTAVTGAEGNLDSGDEFLITNGKWNCNRNIKGDHESGSNAGMVGEPETDGLPEGQLMFTVANYKASVDDLIKEAVAIQAGREPKTYKATLLYTGKTIPASAPALPYKLQLDFPALNVVSAPAPGSGPGSKVPVDVTMDIVTPQVVPNGSEWAWVVAGTDPFRWVVTNKNAVSMA